jgi:hypothetical protein
VVREDQQRAAVTELSNSERQGFGPIRPRLKPLLGCIRAWPIPTRSPGRRVLRRTAEPASSPGPSPGPWRPRPRQRSSERRSRLELSGVTAWSFQSNARFTGWEGTGPGFASCWQSRAGHSTRRRDRAHREATKMVAKPTLPRTHEVGSGTAARPFTWIRYGGNSDV